MLGAIHGQANDFITAIKYFENTLAIQPNAFVAICGLGAAQKNAGQLKQAKISFKHALEMQPDNPDLSLELAGIYIREGDTDKAMELLQKTLANNPKSADALHGIGDIKQKQQSLEESIDYYRRALSLDSKRADTHNSLGYALYTLGHYGNASDHLEQAISINPNYPEAYRNLGQCQVSTGLLDAAEISFKKAISLRPDNTDATISLAMLHERKGNPEETYRLIQKLIKRGIEHSGIGIALLTICRKLDICDEATDYAEKLLKKTSIDNSTKSMLHHQLGSLFDKLKDYEKAFRHYDEGNLLRPDNYKTDKQTVFIDNIINTFSQNHMSSAPKSTSNSKKPVFIIGMPRSATSLVEQILDSHSEFSGAGELDDINILSVDMCKEIGQIEDYPSCFTNADTAMLDKYSAAYLNKISDLYPDAEYITDKMPQNFLRLGLISQLFPKAKIIHCKRNPVDTCLSIYFQYFNESHDYATRLENIGHYYMEYTKLMAHWKKTLDLTIYDIEYDSLLNEPEQQVRSLLDHIGVDWEESCLQFYKSGRHIPTASYNQVQNDFYKDSMYRWKNYRCNIKPLLDSMSSLDIDIS